jgi:hypothetical protein
MGTYRKLIYTSNNRGDGVVVDVQWDSTWWSNGVVAGNMGSVLGNR